MTKTFTYEGRTWRCTQPGFGWMAESDDPTMRICASSWPLLVNEIKNADPTRPRIDGIVAVPGLGCGTRTNG